jgi:hypothetical protein
VFFWVALSDERMGLSFVYAAGPRPRSLSWVRVPWDSRPYFTVSVLRLPFSSPPTTRRVTVELFEPASTRVSSGRTNPLLSLIQHGPHRKTTRPTILLLLCVLVAAGTFLQIRYLAEKGIHMQTHRLMGGIYEVRRSYGRRFRDIHTKFNKD